MEEKEFLEGRVVVKTGDITKMEVGGVVNAANSSLMGGGGVDGAIHRTGGSDILEECKKIRETLYPEGLPTGEAVATTAGKMPAEYVIHTVGPVWHGGKQGEPEKLKNCYLNSLKVAEEKGCESVAFPAISTGVFGYPKDKASRVVSKALSDYFAGDKPGVTKVYLVFFSPADRDEFLSNCEF